MNSRTERLRDDDGPAGDGSTYVYCLARGAAPPDLGGAPPGVASDHPPRALPVGDQLWLVVSSAPGAEFDEESIEAGLRDLDWVSERALAHEAVIEHVFARGPVVPLKLFTLFRDDARAVAEFAARTDELESAFRHLAGKVELGLRVHFDPSRVQELAAGTEPDEIRSGREYLRRKQLQRDRPRELAAEARRSAEDLLARLEAELEALRRKPLPESPGSLLADAACLVSRDRLAPFESLVETESRRLGAEVPILVTLSGPFPPYHFLDGALDP